MSKQEQIEKIEKYFLGYAPLIQIFKEALESGYTTPMSDSDAFDDHVAANPDMPVIAYVERDDKYTGDVDVVLMRIPGRGVGQVAIDFITDERE